MRKPKIVEQTAWMSCYALTLGFLFLIMGAQAQEVLSELKLKEFPLEPVPYPYERVDLYSDLHYVRHRPSLAVSESEFVYLWQPEKSFGEDRVLRKYDLLLNMVWELAFELERKEEILGMHQDGKSLLLLSQEKNSREDLTLARVREIDLDSGFIKRTVPIWLGTDKVAPELHMGYSPDSSQIVFYYYGNRHPRRKPLVAWNYQWSNQRLTYRISHTDHLRFIVLNRRLDTLYQDQIELPEKRTIYLDGGIDNQGNFYVTSLRKDGTLKVIRKSASDGSQRSLAFPDFTELRDLGEPFEILQTPLIGARNRVYACRTERNRHDGHKWTDAFQVVTFNFDQNLVDLQNRVETNSSLLVEVMKTREEYGLKPEKVFDEFLIRELFETDDGGLWLVTQRFETSNRQINLGLSETRLTTESKLSEIVIFEFNPEGGIHKALIIPFFQRVSTPLDQSSQFYNLQTDRHTKKMRFVSWEASGERLNGSQRIFYREIDLANNLVTPRKMLYEGKRRDQYLLKEYVVWQNKDHVVLMMVDGLFGKSWLVSLRLDEALSLWH